MSKLIKITSDCLDEVRKDFEEALQSGKFSDGKITFTKSIGSINRKANVFFTDLAWVKMQTLIREFDKEIAWHGIAFRGDDETKDDYIIKDILVYPQEVTAATVNTDQEKYQTWLFEHDDDVFNNIRMQGHSHVNMGTTPSSVDSSLYDRILEQLDDDMFYIFMIWNKRGDKTIKIYDMAKNVLFETSDCTVSVLEDGYSIERFLKEAKSLVSDKVSNYTNNATPSFGGGYRYGSGYYGSEGSYYSSKDANQYETTKKKGKRKKKETQQVTMFEDDDDDSFEYEDDGWYGYHGRFV